MRTLQEADRETILNYVSREPEMNLFLIGDMENFGVCSEQVNFYVHEEKGRLDFLLLRFLRFYILYSQYEDYNAQAAFDFLKTKAVDCISGKTQLLRRMAPFYPKLAIQNTFMSRLNQVETAFHQPKELTIRPLTADDAPEAMDLLYLIEEFAKTYQSKEKSVHIKEMTEEMAQGGKHIMGGFVDGRLVSIAETSAENSQSAMIVGVATHPDCRRKGYASFVVSALCEDCFARGKQFLCLFYDNPKAGRIYNRIGFKELGEYGMLR